MNQSLASAGLSRDHFDKIARLAHTESGILLEPKKMPMVQSRLLKRLRHLKLDSFEDYIKLLGSDDAGAEKRELISALTTNVTQFFREGHHFDTLCKTALPELIKKRGKQARIRIWSAGCSFGNEPYTIAMACSELLRDHPQVDLRILATDIDPKAISGARRGVFSASELEPVPQEMRQKYTEATEIDDQLRVSAKLRSMVTFQELNLLQPWPMRGKIDVIFCRNVVIYFDAETQATLFQRFHDAMSDEAWLFIGHSERLAPQNAGLFAPAGLTTYRRDGATASTMQSKKRGG
ncbi:MAG: protein-glutamate O-methyltransferase CheR [Pseudomonadota bacterium]